MKSITFNQALFAVGFIGLTLALTGSWQSGAQLRIAYVETGDVGGWIHAALVVQAVAFALPVTTLAFALWRQDRSPSTPVRFPHLLAVVGLFGLMLASGPVPTTFRIFQSWGASGVDGVLVAHAVVLAIPLVVLVVAWRQHASRDRDETSDVVTLPRFVLAFALLGLMVVSPSSAAYLGSPYPSLLTPLFANMVVGGVILLVVAALLSGRVRASMGTTGSSGLLLVVVVLVAGASATIVSDGPRLLVALLAVLGLFWARALPWHADSAAPGPLHSGRVLMVVGLAGTALASDAALRMLDILSLFEWNRDFAVPGYILIGIAAVFNVAVLAAGIHTLRSTGEAVVPGARSTRVTFLTGYQARQGATYLGTTFTLVLSLASIGIFWVVLESEELSPSVGVPIVLLLGSLALLAGLGVRSSTINSYGDGLVSSAALAPTNGLSFSGLLTAVGLLSLVIVAAASPITASVISITVWEGGGPWMTMIVLQVVAFFVPLSLVGAGLLKARQAARSPDDGADAITLPRLALAFALFGSSLAAVSLPVLPESFSTAPTGMTSLQTHYATLAHLSAAAAVLLVGVALLLVGAGRVASFLRGAPLPVMVFLVVLGVVTVVASYGGVTGVFSVLLIALAVVAFLWRLSDDDLSTEAISRVAVWRRAVVPLLALMLLLPTAAGMSGVLALDPTHGLAIVTMLVLTLVFAINVGPLVGAFRRLRNGFVE